MTDAQDRIDAIIATEFPDPPELPQFMSREERERIAAKIRDRHFITRTVEEPAHPLADPEWDDEEKAFLADAAERRRRREVLQQDEVWFDSLGREIQLTEMSMRYKKRVVAFLERRAPMLKLRYELRFMVSVDQMSEASQDAIGCEFDRILEQRPTTWLFQQPLLVRLERLIHDGHDAPEREYYLSDKPAGNPLEEFE